MTMGWSLNELNDVQREAVTWRGSALLVLAGPGSGKTRVLTMRAAHLLETSPEQRFRVLALTFTVKAANEMKERLDQMLGGGRTRVRTSTFHAFAAEVLRQHGSHLGLNPNFEIISEDKERERILTEAARDLGQEHDIPVDDARLLRLLTIYTEQSWTHEDARRRLKDEAEAEMLHLVASAYADRLVLLNMLDFASLIGFTTRLLKQFPGIAKQLHSTYTHVLVDEFQDTNPAQFALLREFVGPNKENLFVVADDDQVIYQWNGASPKRLEQMRSVFGASLLQLPANYRCPPSVVAIGNRLIQHNQTRSENKVALVPVKTREIKDVLRTASFHTETDELRWIGQDIGQRKLNTAETVLLCRTNKLAKTAVSTLSECGVRAFQPVRKTDFDTPGMRFVIALIRAANSPTNAHHINSLAESLYELVNVRYDFRDAEIRAADADGTVVHEIVREIMEDERTDSSIQSLAKSAHDDLLGRADVGKFMERAVSSLEGFYSDTQAIGQSSLVGIAEDVEIITQIVSGWKRRYGQNGCTLSSFVQEVQLAPKVTPVPPGSVKCLTVHTAKGLEFDHVYLFGMVEHQFPSFQSVRSGDDSTEMEEERRNCFVAITRAASSLTVTWAESYYGYDCEPSRFLYEMGLLDGDDN